MASILEILKQIGKSLIISIFTQEFIKELIVDSLEYLAKKTDNLVDDKIVEMVKKALYPEPAQEQENK
jgi:hypothetical protein